MLNKAVLLIESSEEGTESHLFYYDLLPTNVRKIVDKALKKKDNEIECDIYQDGIQFLYSYEEQTKTNIKVSKGDNVEFVGVVYLEHE